MGVRGLFSYLTRHVSSTSKKVDLVEVAKQHSSQDRIVLAVDFFSFATDVLIMCEEASVEALQDEFSDSQFGWSCLSLYSGLLGGEPACYDGWLTSLVLSLRAVGVELVFFVDGANGALADQHRAKFATLKQRYVSRTRVASAIKEFCDNGTRLSVKPWTGEVFLRQQLLGTLHRLNVKVVQCFGEADQEIMKYARKQERVFAILSSDTDFCLVEGCSMIFPRLVDWMELIHLHGKAPEKFVVDIFSAESLATFCGIPVASLPDLALLCGNDISTPVVSQLALHQTLDFPSHSCDIVQAAADLLHSLSDPQIESHQVLKDLICMDENFARVVAVCRTFYTSAKCESQEMFCPADLSPENKHLDRQSFLDFLKQNVLSGKLPSDTLAVACNGIYWRQSVLEDGSLGEPRAVIMTRSMRALQHALLQQATVMEYGQSASHDFCRESVSAEVDRVPEITKVFDCPVGERIAWFWRLMNHIFEPDLQVPVHIQPILAEMPKMSTEDSEFIGELLVAAVLRHFVSLNLQKEVRSSPGLCEWHLDTVLAMWLCCKYGVAASVPAAPFRPSMHCVSMASWLTCVLRHGFRLAALLNLSFAFPEPKEMFGGSLFGALLSAGELAFSSVPDHLRGWMSIVWSIRTQVLNLPAGLALRELIMAGVPDDVWLPGDRVQPSRLAALRTASDRGQFGTTSINKDVTSAFDHETSSRVRLENMEMLEDSDNGWQWSSDELEPNSESNDDVSRATHVTSVNDSVCSGAVPGDVEHLPATMLSVQLPAAPLLNDWATITMATEELGQRLQSTQQLWQHWVRDQEEVEKVVRGKQQDNPQQFTGQDQLVQGETTSLPIVKHRHQILAHVRQHRVTCIQGETGCGKSTSVPQFLLDDWIENGPAVAENSLQRPYIVVTQPRRMAAIMLARRVAASRGEQPGQTIGHGISRDVLISHNTCIVYMTIGYLLQVLVNEPARFARFSHLVLDEVHERSADADLLSLVVRRLMQKYPAPRLVIMSATLQAELFGRYFTTGCGDDGNLYKEPSIFVGVKCFPVEEVYLEDVTDFVVKVGGSHVHGLKKMVASAVAKFERAMVGGQSLPPSVVDPLKDICTEVVVNCCQPGQCMLIFLPGLGDILELHEALTHNNKAKHLRVFALHSLMPREEQEEAFQTPPSTHGHVVLATNIAESSLTLPEVSCVVDFGLHKEIIFDTRARRCCLVHNWCSQASGAQRAGRTGRVRPGTVVRLFTRTFFHQCMPEFESAEITRLPLDKLILQVRQLGDALAEPGEILPPSDLLQEAVQPPSTAQLDAAVELLAQVGALSAADEMADITFLGRIGLNLPVDLSLVRLLLFSVVIGCPGDGVIMAAALATPLDVFSMPSHLVMGVNTPYADSLWRSLCTRWHFDKRQYSEPLMWRNLFFEWLCYRFKLARFSQRHKQPFNRVHAARQFSTKFAVSWQRLLTFESLVRDIASRLIHALPSRLPGLQSLHWLADVLAMSSQGVGEQPDGHPEDVLCGDALVLKSALTAAFAFNILESTPSEIAETIGKGSGKRQRKVAAEVMAAKLDPRRTVYATNVPKHFRADDGCSLAAALPTICLGKDGRIRLVKDHVMIECAKDSDDDEGTAVFHDMPKRGHFLCQLGGGRNRCFLPKVSLDNADEEQQVGVQKVKEQQPKKKAQRLDNAWSTPGSDDLSGATAADNCLTINSRSQPFELQWCLVSGEGASQVRCSWRNPIGHAREMRGTTGGVKTCFAVAAAIQGTEQSAFVHASGVTALPTEHNSRLAQLMLFLFMPHTASVDVCVQDRTGCVNAVRSGLFHTKFEPPLSSDDVRGACEVRQKMSAALEKLHNGGISVDNVQHCLVSFFKKAMDYDEEDCNNDATAVASGYYSGRSARKERRRERKLRQSWHWQEVQGGQSDFCCNFGDGNAVTDQLPFQLLPPYSLDNCNSEHLSSDEDGLLAHEVSLMSLEECAMHQLDDVHRQSLKSPVAGSWSESSACGDWDEALPTNYEVKFIEAAIDFIQPKQPVNFGLVCSDKKLKQLAKEAKYKGGCQEKLLSAHYFRSLPSLFTCSTTGSTLTVSLADKSSCLKEPPRQSSAGALLTMEDPSGSSSAVMSRARMRKCDKGEIKHTPVAEGKMKATPAKGGKGIPVTEGKKKGPVLAEGKAKGTPVAEGKTKGTPVAEGKTKGTPFAQGKAKGMRVAGGKAKGSPLAAGKTMDMPVAEGKTKCTSVGAGKTKGTPIVTRETKGTLVVTRETKGMPAAEGKTKGTPVTAGKNKGMPLADGKANSTPSAEGRVKSTSAAGVISNDKANAYGKPNGATANRKKPSSGSNTKDLVDNDVARFVDAAKKFIGRERVDMNDLCLNSQLRRMAQQAKLKGSNQKFLSAKFFRSLPHVFKCENSRSTVIVSLTDHCRTSVDTSSSSEDDSLFSEDLSEDETEEMMEFMNVLLDVLWELEDAVPVQQLRRMKRLRSLAVRAEASLEKDDHMDLLSEAFFRSQPGIFHCYSKGNKTMVELSSVMSDNGSSFESGNSVGSVGTEDEWETVSETDFTGSSLNSSGSASGCDLMQDVLQSKEKSSAFFHLASAFACGRKKLESAPLEWDTSPSLSQKTTARKQSIAGKHADDKQSHSGRKGEQSPTGAQRRNSKAADGQCGVRSATEKLKRPPHGNEGARSQCTRASLLTTSSSLKLFVCGIEEQIMVAGGKMVDLSKLAQNKQLQRLANAAYVDHNCNGPRPAIRLKFFKSRPDLFVVKQTRGTTAVGVVKQRSW